MKNPVNYILLLLALVLACAGARADRGDGILHSVSQHSWGEEQQGKLSEVGQQKSPGLQQTEERVNFVNHFPSPPSKHQPNGFASTLHAFEVRLQVITSLYISQAKAISRSLTTSDIIFPFHYFW